MQRYILPSLLALMVSAGAAYADDACKCEPGKFCLPQCTRDVCMNIVCTYHGKDDKDAKECKAVVKLVKDVTREGGEVADESGVEDPIKFEVSCDDHIVYNDGAHRFTDLLGTRIQAITGPSPSLILGRGELHEGPHYARSVLEFDDHRLHGSCFIYPGQP